MRSQCGCVYTMQLTATSISNEYNCWAVNYVSSALLQIVFRLIRAYRFSLLLYKRLRDGYAETTTCNRIAGYSMNEGGAAISKIRLLIVGACAKHLIRSLNCMGCSSKHVIIVNGMLSTGENFLFLFVSQF